MSGECVKVIVRCRPMNQRERDLKCENIIDMVGATNQVILKNLDDDKQPPKNFTFDGAYNIDSITENIYNDVGFPLVESVVEGYNGTVFAYGQTGCGKSFTMQGITTPASQRGIIPRSFEHIFEATASDADKKFLIRAAYLEIYNEAIRDLLSTTNVKNSLDLHEHPDKGVYINDLSWHEVKRMADCEKLMDRGNKNRSTGATLMNADSSRSHSIFTINVEMCQKGEDGEDKYKAGKLNLVDLAGSERQSKTGATGDRFKEATKINLSLSALGNVISALVDGKSKHIPYRDSKLTRLLQDSLGGNTKTLMIAAVSPAADNYEETLSTLRYANRAKNIKNKPKINEDPKDALLRQLQEEINLLKAQLAGSLGGGVPQFYIPPTQDYEPRASRRVEYNRDEVEEEKRKLREEYEEQIKQIKDKYEEERSNKEQLEKEMERLKEVYDVELHNIDAKTTGAAPLAVVRQKPPRKHKDGKHKNVSSATLAEKTATEKQQQQQPVVQSRSQQSFIDPNTAMASQQRTRTNSNATATPLSPTYQILLPASQNQYLNNTTQQGSHSGGANQTSGLVHSMSQPALDAHHSSKLALQQQQDAVFTPVKSGNSQSFFATTLINSTLHPTIATTATTQPQQQLHISASSQQLTSGTTHSTTHQKQSTQHQHQNAGGAGPAVMAVNHVVQPLDVHHDDGADVDPLRRLQELQEMMVGGEQANNKELKKKRTEKKKYAEERKKYLQDALRNDDDEAFMLRVYDSVQEEVKYKSKLLEKEIEKVKFLDCEVKDIQMEFEQEREEYLDTIRKQERQIKLLSKILMKVQPIISYDCNYYNIDKVQASAVWVDEIQDWNLPDLKREKLSLPAMTTQQSHQSNGDADNQNGDPQSLQNNSSDNKKVEQFMISYEQEPDRYRLKLENTNYDGGLSYFKTKRQSELLNQTYDLRHNVPINNNGRISPIRNGFVDPVLKGKRK